MPSFWEKTKAASKSAAEKTKKGAKKLKLKAEIEGQKKEILEQKKLFGLAVYDSLDANNSQEAHKIFIEHQEKVAVLEEKIAKRIGKLAVLNGQVDDGGDAASDSDSD